MYYTLLVVFLMFMIYSFFGYIVEIISIYREKKIFTLNRGFLIGPYIPVFGVGALAIVFFLTKYKDDIMVLFVLSTTLCSTIEYMTSYVMEKIFNLRWWDYSNDRFNINGRVCLLNSILFGAAGVLITHYINPVVVGFLGKLPKFSIYWSGSILLVIFILDVIVSIITVVNIKIDVKKYTKKDATSAIKFEVAKKLRQHFFLVDRLFDAFPNIIEKRNNKFLDYKKLVQKIEDSINKIKNKKKDV